VRNEGKGIIRPAHSSLFEIDEDALPVGAAMMAGMAAAFLKTDQ